jgi:hypothetical protein
MAPACQAFLTILEFFALEITKAYQQLRFGVAYRHLMDFSKTYFLEGVLNSFQHYVMAFKSTGEQERDRMLEDIQYVVAKVFF